MLAAMISGCGSGQAEAPTDGTGDAAAVQEEAEAPSADAEAETEAPAADAEATDAAAEAVTLKWAIWDKDITPYWNALKDAYEASHEGVTIEMVDLGSTDYMTVLATELSGSGSDFDVVTIKDVPGHRGRRAVRAAFQK